MIQAQVKSITKGSDSNYYTRLQKVKEDGMFGSQVLTGFVCNESEPDVDVDQEVELSSNQDSTIHWQA